MYSGNHSPANPLAHLLQAAQTVQGAPALALPFRRAAGWARRKSRPSRRRTISRTSFRSPYSRSRICATPSLPRRARRLACEEMVGIVHPCKIYGAMAVGRRSSSSGLDQVHIADILDENSIGRHVRMATWGRRLGRSDIPRHRRPANCGRWAMTRKRVLTQRFTQAYLCRKILRRVEQALKMTPLHQPRRAINGALLMRLPHRVYAAS